MTSHPASDAKTEPKSTSREVKSFLDSLPVQPSKSNTIADMIAEDRSEEESFAVRILFTGLTWATVACALSAVVYLTWLLVTEI